MQFELPIVALGEWEVGRVFQKRMEVRWVGDKECSQHAPALSVVPSFLKSAQDLWPLLAPWVGPLSLLFLLCLAWRKRLY